MLAEPVASGSATPIGDDDCAPLTVRLVANKSDDIDDYWWEAVNGEIKQFAKGAITEILFRIPGTYTISLDVVSKEGHSNKSSVGTVTVKDTEDCEQGDGDDDDDDDDDLLKACFNVTILYNEFRKEFRRDEPWVANKTPDDGLKVKLNADCSMGDNITGYKWNVVPTAKEAKGIEGNHSEVIFDEENDYMITLEITDVNGNTASSESKRITIGKLCAEFELPNKIGFNEGLKRPLNVDTCNPMPPDSINEEWAVYSNFEGELECGEPVIGGGYIVFDEPPIETSCYYTITLTVTDDNGLPVSNYKEVTVLGYVQEEPEPLQFRFSNGEDIEKDWYFHQVLKIEVLIDLNIDFDNCSDASLYINFKPPGFPLEDDTIELLEEYGVEHVFLSPKTDGEGVDMTINLPSYDLYALPYESSILSYGTLYHKTILNIPAGILDKGGLIKGEYIFHAILVQEGTSYFNRGKECEFNGEIIEAERIIKYNG